MSATTQSAAPTASTPRTATSRGDSGASESSEPPSTGTGDVPRPASSSRIDAREIQLQNPQRRRGVAARALRPWLERVVDELAPTATSLVVRFVGDDEIRRLNATWRGKDEPTDVLSFPGDLRHPEAGPDSEAALETPRPDEAHLGDIVISVPTARRQAVAGGFDGAATDSSPLERELRLLILHGLLHCLGFDHETDDGAMDRLEARLRRRWLDAPAGSESTRAGSSAGAAP